MRGIKVFDINVAVAGDRGRSSTGSQISSTGHDQDTRFQYNQPVRNETPTATNRIEKVVTAMTCHAIAPRLRSEEHTSELQSLMRISYAVFCLTKKKTPNNNQLPT